MTKNTIILGLLAASCGIDSTATTGFGDETGGQAREKEAWSGQDAPTLFTSNLEYRLESLPMQGEAANVPWAGSYWPTYEDNINYKWDGSASMSASAKFAKAFGLDQTRVENAVSSEHGIDSLSWAKTCTTDSQCDANLGEAYRIERGRVGPPVRGATLTGHGPTVLRAIDRIGSDLGFAIGICGKDGQDVPVADGQPTLRLPRVTVGGRTG